MKKPALKETAFWQETALFEEREILSDLLEKKGPSLFLGKYSLNEAIAVLKKRNFLSDAQKRNLWPLKYDLDSSEYPLQRFQIFYEDKKPENLIVDLKIREGKFKPKDDFFLTDASSEFKFLIFEWLTLQNPRLSFSQDKTPLPGQRYPGLGLGKKVLDVFVYLARLLGCDGILAFPAYFHNALLFSRYFHFLNPEKQAEIVAVTESTRDVTFKQLSWIVYLECLRDKNNKIFEWKAEELIFPLNKKLRSYFDSKEYKKILKDARKKLLFSVDWDCYQKKVNSEK